MQCEATSFTWLLMAIVFSHDRLIPCILICQSDLSRPRPSNLNCHWQFSFFFFPNVLCSVKWALLTSCVAAAMFCHIMPCYIAFQPTAAAAASSTVIDEVSSCCAFSESYTIYWPLVMWRHLILKKGLDNLYCNNELYLSVSAAMFYRNVRGF